MKNIIEAEVGFVRPDALREELSAVKVIGSVETGKMPNKVEVVKVVEMKETKKEELSKVKVIGKVDLEKKPKVEVVKVVETKKEETELCPSYFTQYYG